jgi:hypothetical protein
LTCTPGRSLWEVSGLAGHVVSTRPAGYPIRGVPPAAVRPPVSLTCFLHGGRTGAQAFKASNKKAHTALEEVVRHTQRLDNSGRLHTEVAGERRQSHRPTLQPLSRSNLATVCFLDFHLAPSPANTNTKPGGGTPTATQWAMHRCHRWTRLRIMRGTGRPETAIDYVQVNSRTHVPIDEGVLRSYVPLNKDCGAKGFNGQFE